MGIRCWGPICLFAVLLSSTSCGWLEGEVSSLDGVQSATVRIEVRGNLLAFEDGKADAKTGWTGSGFFLDEKGTIVTSDHVVAGAQDVYALADGEERWQEARLVGTDECSDIAVLDIDGEGYPYLGWHRGKVEPSLEVHAAGYPAGEPFLSNEGEVLAVDSKGPQFSSYIDSPLEHNAITEPGSSGGPVVDGSGRVVGVTRGGSEWGSSVSVSAKEPKPSLSN